MPLEDIRGERIKKLNALKQKGRDPYPATTHRTHTIAELLKNFEQFAASKKIITAAGRIMAKREHGGSTFFDIHDGSGRMQIYFKADVLGDAYNDALECIDNGDFISVEGILFETKKQEKTIEARQWAVIAKSLLPLPEKWHGLQDIEERFRKRYLDLLMNGEVRTRFERRSAIIQFIREILDKNKFIEVETPLLHPLAGGALAEPFLTHHNALGMDLYLRIAPELYLKRLLIGGFERVYEIGKNFRNEGIDAEHNPEFTMLECYAAYWDENDMMEFVENIFMALLKHMHKTPQIEFDTKEVIFKKPFARMLFKDALARYALITDYERETQESLAVRAQQLGIETAPHESKGKIADTIYKKICRPYLVQPTFVINHPLEISPLAKKRAENPLEVRRFQLIAAGMELTNGFAELNDPLDQRERFNAQEKERTDGEKEAHRLDEDFIKAMEYGMPPSAGLGIGIDRLVMLLTNTKNIKEVILFPTLRPR